MVRGFKTLLIIGVLFAVMGTSVSYADEMADLTAGIEAYKKGQYEDCITKLKSVVKDDPTSAIGYYYLGLAYTKTDKKISAIQNYNKVINLGSDTTLVTLAKKGKSSLGKTKVTEIEEQIEDIEEEYNPIFNDSAVTTTKQPEEKTTEPKTTKVIKASDYAKPQNNNQAKFEFDPNREPTNDEIVNAIKILQKAGLLQNGAAAITGGGQQQMQQMMPQMDSRTQQMQAVMQMMNNGNGYNNNNMMPMMQMMNSGGKVDPQMMQMMLMQQMMPNFSGGNNNNGY